jgi:3-ketosteroid 9alpha-monooxygenase subunit A
MTIPVRRRSTVRRFPSQGIPRGWYQLGWSTDFEAGAPKPLHYFESDLVAYRGQDTPDGAPGQVTVLDAYCRHLGAHLAIGGRVEGDCIRCPYHGWLYDSAGTNIEVPYGDQRPTGVRMSSWPTKEVDGVVLVWYDPAGVEPAVPAPSEFARSPHPSFPLAKASKVWPAVPMTPQAAADNVCDAAHFTYIHGSRDMPTLAGYGGDGAVFRAGYEIEFGAGFERTFATPDGPVSGTISTEAHGLGLLWNRMGGVDDVISLLGVTPIDPGTADVRVSVWVPTVRRSGHPMPEKVRDAWIRQQHSQVDADLLIWANQTYIDRPPFLPAEAEPMRAFRAWSARWYAA